MRGTKSMVWLAVFDFVLFVVAWWLRMFPPRIVVHIGYFVTFVYWISAFIGLVLAVLGFWIVTRGKREDLPKAVLSILLALVPGCVGLVGFLSAVGSQMV